MSPQSGPLPVFQPAGTYPAPAAPSRLGGRPVVIGLLILVVLFVGGTAAFTVLYINANSHLNSTTQQLSATKSALGAADKQLAQAKAGEQTLTQQNQTLNTKISGMTPCATAAKALADLVRNDLNTNANPFLDKGIVDILTNEMDTCE